MSLFPHRFIFISIVPARHHLLNLWAISQVEEREERALLGLKQYLQWDAAEPGQIWWLIGSARNLGYGGNVTRKAGGFIQWVRQSGALNFSWTSGMLQGYYTHSTMYSLLLYMQWLEGRMSIFCKVFCLLKYKTTDMTGSCYVIPCWTIPTQIKCICIAIFTSNTTGTRCSTFKSIHN